MTDDDTFSRLMARLRAGEDAAAREVFERFAGRLVALARRRCNRLLARKVDPEDVVQSAYKSFFVRHRAGTRPPGFRWVERIGRAVPLGRAPDYSPQC